MSSEGNKKRRKALFAFIGSGQNTVVINSESFLPEDLKIIQEHFPKIIETHAQDNRGMACHWVGVGRKVVLGQGISETLRQAIEAEGFKVYELDMSELLKAGGSVKCITLELW